MLALVSYLLHLFGSGMLLVCLSIMFVSILSRKKRSWNVVIGDTLIITVLSLLLLRG